MRKIKLSLVTVIGMLAITASSNAFAAQKFFKPFMSESTAQRLKTRNSFMGFSGDTMTEAQFNKVVQDTTSKYKDLAAAHGATLVVSADWSDDTVNAYADQDGKNWNVHFFGGLARTAPMNVDGMALVICHELSHHFGGFPFFTSWGSEWGSVEGQADYGAAHMCAKYVWKGQRRANAAAAKTVDPYAKSKCDDAYSETADRNICYRTANAAYILAQVLAGGESQPSFQTPDTTVVKKTNEDHPEAQCRLDTYFQAALCPTAVDYSVIPGKDNASGQQSMDAQKEAFQYSCSQEDHPEGARPACWFHEMN